MMISAFKNLLLELITVCSGAERDTVDTVMMQWYEIIIIVVATALMWVTRNMLDFFIDQLHSMFGRMWTNGEFIAMPFSQNMLINVYFCGNPL